MITFTTKTAIAFQMKATKILSTANLNLTRMETLLLETEKWAFWVMMTRRLVLKSVFT